MREIGHFVGGKEVKAPPAGSATCSTPIPARSRPGLPWRHRRRSGAPLRPQPQRSCLGGTNASGVRAVLFRFLELLNRTSTASRPSLLRTWQTSRRQGRHPAPGSKVGRIRLRHPAPDQGRIQRGSRPRHRTFTRCGQALGVVAASRRQLPGHDPDVEVAPALACGNAFILSRRKRPFRADGLAALPGRGRTAGRCAQRRQWRQEAVDALITDRRVKAVGFVGSSPIAEYIYATAARLESACNVLGGAKNHMIIMPDADMDQAVDALIGAGLRLLV